MVLTVGKGKEAIVVNKRVSLADRLRIRDINAKRRSEGKKGIKGEEETLSQKERDEEKRLLKEAGYEKASKDVIENLKEKERAKKALGADYVVKEGDRYVAIREQTDEAPVERSRPMRSTAVGNSGVQQFPGVQTSTGGSSTGEIFSRDVPVEERVSRSQPVPVASSELGTLYADSGKVYFPVPASSANEDSILLSELSSPAPKEEKGTLLSDERGSEFLTPGIALSDERREDLVQIGSYLEEKGDVKESRATRLTGATTGIVGLKVLGANIKEIGINPKEYTATNVVLPATGGAIIGGASASVLKQVPKGLTGLGLTTGAAASTTKGVEIATNTIGIATLGATVASRDASQQRPDVLFAFAGGSAGANAKPVIQNTVPPKSLRPSEVVEFVSKGFEGDKTGAVFKGGRRVSPISKAQLRQQKTNPNIVQYDKGISVERTPRKFQAKQIINDRDVAVAFGTTRKTGEGREYSYVAGKVETKSFESTDNVLLSKSFNTQLVGLRQVVPKGGSGTKEALPYSKIFGGFKDSEVSSGSTKLNVIQKTTTALPSANVPKAIPQKPSTDYNNNLAVINKIPEYELVPNVVPKTTSQYAVRGQNRGGFRQRSGGERVLNFRPDIQPAKTTTGTELVVAADVIPETNIPYKDIALQREINVAANEIPQRLDVTSGKTFDITSPLTGEAVRVDTQPRQVVGIVPKTDQDNKQELETNQISKYKILSVSKTTPAQVIGSKPLSVQSIKVDQLSEQVSLQEQVPLQDYRLVQETSTRITPVFIPPPTGGGGGSGLGSNKLTNVTLREEPPIPRNKTPTYPVTDVPTGKRLTTNLGDDSGRGKAQYRVIVGKPGNKIYKDLGIGGEELIYKGGSIAKNTAAATVTVQPLNNTQQRNVSTILGKEFEKTKQGVYVQKTEYRISTTGEKEDIPGASKRKRLTNNDNYLKAFKLNKEGYSLRNIRKKLL